MQQDKIVTIFCSFTRPWAVDRWLENLTHTMKLKHDPANFNLAFILDGDMPSVSVKLQKYAKQHGYRAIDIIMNREHEPAAFNINMRRTRIAQVKEQSKRLILKQHCDFVIGIEDDTVFEFDCFCSLLAPFEWGKDVGFVEGVQCGRRDFMYIGAWSADDFEYVKRIETLPMPAQKPRKLIHGKYEEIDAGGFYYYATTRELYLEHTYNWFDEPYGPDVVFGLWLRNKGYKCLIDWSTVTGHNDHNNVIYPQAPVPSVCYHRDSDHKWERQDKVYGANS